MSKMGRGRFNSNQHLVNRWAPRYANSWETTTAPDGPEKQVDHVAQQIVTASLQTFGT